MVTCMHCMSDQRVFLLLHWIYSSLLWDIDAIQEFSDVLLSYQYWLVNECSCRQTSQSNATAWPCNNSCLCVYVPMLPILGTWGKHSPYVTNKEKSGLWKHNTLKTATARHQDIGGSLNSVGVWLQSSHKGRTTWTQLRVQTLTINYEQEETDTSSATTGKGTLPHHTNLSGDLRPDSGRAGYQRPLQLHAWHQK